MLKLVRWVKAEFPSILGFLVLIALLFAAREFTHPTLGWKANVRWENGPAVLYVDTVTGWCSVHQTSNRLTPSLAGPLIITLPCGELFPLLVYELNRPRKRGRILYFMSGFLP